MAKNNQRKRKHSQGKTQELIDNAAKRGIVPIRRKIHPDSYDRLNDIIEQIEHPYLNTEVRKFTADSVVVTMIGTSHLKARNLRNGPTTESILGGVPNTKIPLWVRLGAVGIYGNELVKPKLAFSLHQDELHQEYGDLIQAYEKRRYGLHIPRHQKEHGFQPHGTVAILGTQAVSYFKNTRIQDQINGAIRNLGDDPYILLSGVEVPPVNTAEQLV